MVSSRGALGARLSLLSAALAASLGTLGAGRVSDSVPEVSGSSRRSRGKGRGLSGKQWRPKWSKYQPHQGKAETLRRRQGGNAYRIRMERLGLAWDDVAGRYVGPRV